MADDFTTPDGILAVLADTVGYSVDGSTTNAQRRLMAREAQLNNPMQSSGRGEKNLTVSLEMIERDIQRIQAWLSANSTPTDSQLCNNPSVTHADFSTFRGYQ